MHIIALSPPTGVQNSAPISVVTSSSRDAQPPYLPHQLKHSEHAAAVTQGKVVMSRELFFPTSGRQGFGSLCTIAQGTNQPALSPKSKAITVLVSFPVMYEIQYSSPNRNKLDL